MTAAIRVRGDKRDPILRAALELFAERGFHGTAVPLVAERAKVGAGTIYRYFASKEALVNELYRHCKQAFLDYLLDDFPLQAPVRDQFHALFQRVLGFAHHHPQEFQFLELHHHAPYLDGASRRLEEQGMSMILAFLENAAHQRVIKDVNPHILLAVVWGAMVRLVRSVNEGNLVLDQELGEEAERVCWEAIRV